MANLILSWDNRADAATLSGGAWSASLPLANLKTKLLSEVARSTNLLAASTQFDAALDKARPIRFFAIMRHNLSLNGKYRLRTSNVAGDFSAPLYDSGWKLAWPAIYNNRTLHWLSENWYSGQPLAENIASYPALILEDMQDLILARYFRVEFDDASNAAGYVQAGRFWLSANWQLARNMSYGAASGWEDKSTVEESLSGVEYFDQRPVYRVFKASIDWMNYAEGFGQYYEMQRKLGVTGEVLVIPDAADKLNFISRSFLGRPRALSLLEQNLPLNTKGNVEFKEII